MVCKLFFTSHEGSAAKRYVPLFRNERFLVFPFEGYIRYRALCARKCDVPAAYQSPMAHEGATKGSKSKYLSCEIRNILHNTRFEISFYSRHKEMLNWDQSYFEMSYCVISTLS